MTFCRFVAIGPLALLAAAAVWGPAIAQSDTGAPTSSPATAAKSLAASALDAQKAAFLAMPEVDRKAVQDALVWLGFYNGAVDAAFGKRTLDSILAYQASVKAPSDGLVSAAQLAALKAAAQKARAAVDFQLVDDDRTGARIGAPLKLLGTISSATGQTRMTNRDGSVSLELVALAGGEGSLASLYKWRAADANERKVTYKALKADAFFVVSGEEAGRKFYLRYDQAAAGAGDAGAMRGFSFAYPMARAAELDRVALAIADSFEPFPSLAKTPHTPTTSILLPPEIVNPPGPSPTPGPPTLAATALIVAPGQAVTALNESECRAPTIDGNAAKFSRADAAAGLALLTGDFGAGAPSLRFSVGASDLIVLSLAPGGPGKASLEAANAILTPISGTRQAVVAALSTSGRGAPVFDRQAGLVSIVASSLAPPKRLGAVELAEPHELVGVETLKAFIPQAKVEPAPNGSALGAAEIARDMRSAIVGVFCSR